MKKQADKKWQGALTLSVTLHLILIGVFLFGMPSVFKTFPEEKDALTLEILPLSAITNVKSENKSVQKEKEAKKSREVKKTQPKPKPTPKPPEPQKKKIEKKAPEQAKKKEVIPVKEKKTVEKLKEQPKPIPKKDEDSIDSILKNLEQDSQGTDAKISTRSHTAKVADDKHSRGINYDEDSPLSITEKLWVKNQMQKYWRPPVGSQNVEQVRILIHITIGKNGAIQDAVIKIIICPTNSETTCKLTAESAIRAIREIWKASPLENLLPERYNGWKEFDLFFDPSFLSQ